MKLFTNFTVLLAIVMILHAIGCDETDPDHVNNGESDADGDGDADSDGDADGDGDADSDADTYCQYKEYDTNDEDFADEFCCLCQGCYFGSAERSSVIVDSTGLTCSELELDMTNPNNASKPGSETCHELQNKYRDTCCNPACTPPPVKVDWEPVEPPFSQGNQPMCHLCWPGEAPNGQFPLKPYTITAVLYIPGNPTCEDLYWMGRTGNIPDALCYPMQDYMEEPCGCSPPDSQTYPEGREPWCDICPNGNYPLRPVVVPPGIDNSGNHSCKDFYWMGRQGSLSVSRCQQLQKELREPCGCLLGK